MSFRGLMRNVTDYGVRDLINALVVKHGTLTEVAERFGVSHQTLSNWRAGKSKEMEKVFKFLKEAQKDLKLSDAATYKKAVKK